MKNFSIDLNSFKLGQVANFVNSTSSDYPYYETSKNIQNMIVTPYNCLIRRPGSKVIKEVSHNNKNTRLFSFNHKDNSILIEIYSNVLAFYVNGQAVMQDNKEFIIVTKWVNQEEIAGLTFLFDDIKNVFYIFSHNQSPKELSFTSDYIFTLKDIEYLDGPYLEINSTSTNINIVVGDAGSTLHASADLFVKARDEGRLIRIGHKGIWGYGKITFVADAKTANIDIKKTFNDTTATTEFRFGAWNSVDGFPTKATLYNGRLYCTNTITDKKTVWVSKMWSYNDFSPTSQEMVENVLVDVVGYDNSISMNIPFGKENIWLASSRESVLVGTTEGVFSILPLDTDEDISPYNFTVKQIAAFKSSEICKNADTITFYADYNKKNVLCAEISNQKLLTNHNTTVLAKNITEKGIKDILFMEYPFNMLWALLEDGTMAMATLNDYADKGIVYSWTKQLLSPEENTQVLNFCTNYSKDSQHLWLFVRRFINNIEYFTIESIEFKDVYNIYEDDYVNSNIYLDSYLPCTIKDNSFKILNRYSKQNIDAIIENSEIYFHNLQSTTTIVKLNNSIYNDQNLYYGFGYSSWYVTPNLESISFNSTYYMKTIDNLILNVLNTKLLEISSVVDSKLQLIDTQGKSNLYKDDKSALIKLNLPVKWGYYLNIKLAQSLPIDLNIKALKINLTYQ